MVVLMLVFAVIFIYRAKLTKNSLFYLTAGYCCVVAFAFSVNVFGQFILCILIMVVANIIALIVIRPKLKDYIVDAHTKTLETIDASGPIHLREIFSASFAVKLERDYGRRKAMAICMVLGIIVAIPIIIPIMSLLVLLHIITWHLVGVTLLLTFISVTITYWDFYDKLPGRIQEPVN
jgi:hypothetical protein